MGKNIFESVEVENLAELAMIEAPKFAHLEAHAEQESEDVYEGPTAEEIRQEAMQERLKWEGERAQLLSEAQAKADEIVLHTEQKLQESRRLAEEELTRRQEESQAEAERLITQAKGELEKAKLDASLAYEKEMDQARQKGRDEGYEEGFKQGNEESMRLVNRIHVIIDKTLEKRNDILTDVESQVVELTLLMVRKVVKVLSENQKSIVINNIMQALKKIKGRGDVVIRVNMQDLSLSSEHINDFIEALERRGNITLAEDSTIEPGGCVIETDFGEIDARISSQLHEIEGRIRDLMPITTKPSPIDEE
ncbi:flagellar assembly protein FliH [Entomospira culicis]|uniref:Flagellar assembly protein FliH n=1 Tax=Entomospira culicis TaxID=2719989 RepID=A0A968GFR4_9SPIO|nr:flagellar assembly protein FliH [Entomospira culicis]NIZ19381.1 flagellar assembly protein FliH [Entomospira culicis]NIZ69714.1 flagellar assembly protein FliH [Entomospira culicis]WDI36825.1 flagellar assembly protein FliH [Entomospira culicis]WDI38454.1 flagellar assembly protein FliH [Entomospira culicis]